VLAQLTLQIIGRPCKACRCTAGECHGLGLRGPTECPQAPVSEGAGIGSPQIIRT
jgi:hypothetical protein